MLKRSGIGNKHQKISCLYKIFSTNFIMLNQKHVSGTKKNELRNQPFLDIHQKFPNLMVYLSRGRIPNANILVKDELYFRIKSI